MFSHRYQTPRREVSAPALECLKRYAWPGNVRQLKNVVERLIVSGGTGPITADELPPEVQVLRSSDVRASRCLRPAARADEVFDRMVVGGESFWSVVYGPFMTRDLTRDDVRMIVQRGLQLTRGNYAGLMKTFNMTPEDYKRFLNFLRKHQCQLNFHPFRAPSGERTIEPSVH